jgi:hypothetical protein
VVCIRLKTIELALGTRNLVFWVCWSSSQLSRIVLLGSYDSPAVPGLDATLRI